MADQNYSKVGKAIADLFKLNALDEFNNFSKNPSNNKKTYRFNEQYILQVAHEHREGFKSWNTSTLAVNFINPEKII